MALTAEILNAVPVRDRLHHAPFDIGVRLTDSTGGQNFYITITASATNDEGVTIFVPIIAASPSGMTRLNNVISGIEIPTDYKQVDLWFVINENQSLTGEWTSITYTITPSSEAAIDGTPDVVVTRYADDYLVGGDNLNQILQGAGEVVHDGLPMGLYTKDGATLTWTSNDVPVVVDQVPGAIAIGTDNLECRVRFTPNQFTLEMLKVAHRLVGTVESSSNILYRGATYNGLILEGIPAQGLVRHPQLELIGTSARFDNMTIRWIFYRTVKTAATEIILKSNAPSGIPLEFMVMQNPITKSFYQCQVIYPTI